MDNTEDDLWSQHYLYRPAFIHGRVAFRGDLEQLLGRTPTTVSDYLRDNYPTTQRLVRAAVVLPPELCR